MDRDTPQKIPVEFQTLKTKKPELSTTNVYLRGLEPNTTDEDLRRLCSLHGKILSAKAIVDHSSQQCKGYGFVMFASSSSALAAINSLRHIGIQATFAKSVRSNSENDSKTPLDPTNLYISNLPKRMDETMLLGMLNNYGTVMSCRILRDAQGYSRGVGLARMDSRISCHNVIYHLDGKTLTGSPESLVVKFADGPINQKRPPKQRKPKFSVIKPLGTQNPLQVINPASHTPGPLWVPNLALEELKNME